MIKIDIDGKELTVEQGTSIIQAADNAGIEIPRFCYHKKLSVAANCRMCLVEVVNAPKPMPACATPVAEGMQVKTKSAKALMAQRAVMEFLLINHPLDCPICDQGGQCELQDVAMGYGEGISQYNLGKRTVDDRDIGPLIATGMTRCIHCTRCVRFGEEVAGMKELGGLGRGESTEIRTFIDHSVDSELSGNMIDVCPVGALTSKPFRYTARAWELKQYPSIAVHDPVGSNIYVHSKNSTVKQVVPRENEDLNEVWLSDRDRFSYEALNNGERLLKPLVKINGALEAVDWETALTESVRILKDQVRQKSTDLIGLVSPNATVEEGYLLQKIIRNLGSNSIDFRLRTISDYKLGTDNITLAGVEKCDSVLLIACGPRKSIPMLNHRIRKAARKGAKINTINLAAYDWNYNVAVDNIVEAEHLVSELTAVLKQLYKLKNGDIPASIRKVDVSDNAKAIAQNLFDSKKSLLILGELALRHPDHSYIHTLYQAIKQLLDHCGGIVLSEGANSQGLALAGVLPHKQAGGYNISKPGDTVRTAFNRPDGVGTYILFNVEPEFDCVEGTKALAKLKRSNKVICISPFVSENMNAYADVVLPLAPFTETSGTLVNLDHKWQTFTAAVQAGKHSQVRPGWKILTALARLLDLSAEEFNYESSADIKQEVFGLSSNLLTKNSVKDVVSHEQNLIENYQSKLEVSQNKALCTARLITEVNCYRTDSIVRRASSLQATNDAKHTRNIYISKQLSEQLGVGTGESLGMTQDCDLRDVVRKIAVIDERLPGNTVYMTTGDVNTLSVSNDFEQIILINKK